MNLGLAYMAQERSTDCNLREHALGIRHAITVTIVNCPVDNNRFARLRWFAGFNHGHGSRDGVFGRPGK